jgi:hypothetical protein
MMFLFETSEGVIFEATKTFREGNLSMTTQPAPEPKRHWLRVLFVLPFVALLWVSSYNRLTPELFGFPFFYWYQLFWVLMSAALTGIIYKVEH